MTAAAPKAGAVTAGLAASLAAIALVWAVAMLVAAARFRGVWIDEFWSVWMSPPGLSATGAASRWIHDVHPPFYSALSWLVSPLVGEDLFARRLLNLLPLAWLSGASAYAAIRFPEAVRFILTLLVLTLAGVLAVYFFPEHRSYFTILCLTTTTLIYLYCAFQADRDLAFRSDWPAAMALGVSATGAFCLHYVAAVTIGLMLGVFCLELIRRRLWRWAAVVFAAGVLGASMLCASVIWMLPWLRAAGSNFWIVTGFRAAMNTTLKVVGVSALENLVAAAAAALAFVAALVRSRRGEPIPSGVVRYVACCGLALCLAIVTVLGINAVRPIVAYRYLTPMVCLAMAGVAALACDRLFSRRWIFAAFILNAIAVITFHGWQIARQTRWEATAREIAAAVKSCPDARVYVPRPAFFADYPPTLDSAPVYALGYRHIAAAYGFGFRDFDPGSAQAVEVSDHCPTIFWVEQIGQRRDLQQLMAATFVKSLPAGFNINAGRVSWREQDKGLLFKEGGDLSFIVVVPPASNATATHASGT
jgi:hypothetical protein